MTTGDWQQDRIVIDDPAQATIDTPAMRAAVLDWWNKVVDSTARQRAHGVEPVVIMSRVHDEDLAAPLVLDFPVKPPPGRVTVNGRELHQATDPGLGQVFGGLIGQQAQAAHSHPIHDPVLPDVYAVIGRERGVGAAGVWKAIARANQAYRRHAAGVALTRAFGKL